MDSGRFEPDEAERSEVSARFESERRYPEGVDPRADILAFGRLQPKGTKCALTVRQNGR